MSERTCWVVFDGDDTLWRTIPLYADAKQRYLALLSAISPSERGLELEFEERDLKNVGRWGFTVERFRNSMLETYREVASRMGQAPELKREEQISRIATSVVRKRVHLMPYARFALEKLARSARLVLLTKGEYELQKRRVSETHVGSFFERVVIVEHKDKSTFKQLVREIRAKPSQVWSVGDSLRSDIRPALAAGLGAVWIPQDTWAYERAAPLEHATRFHQAPTLKELPRVLGHAWEVQR